MKVKLSLKTSRIEQQLHILKQDNLIFLQTQGECIPQKNPDTHVNEHKTPKSVCFSSTYIKLEQ